MSECELVLMLYVCKFIGFVFLMPRTVNSTSE